LMKLRRALLGGPKRIPVPGRKAPANVLRINERVEVLSSQRNGAAEMYKKTRNPLYRIEQSFFEMQADKAMLELLRKWREAPFRGDLQARILKKYKSHREKFREKLEKFSRKVNPLNFGDYIRIVQKAPEIGSYRKEVRDMAERNDWKGLAREFENKLLDLVLIDATIRKKSLSGANELPFTEGQLNNLKETRIKYRQMIEILGRACGSLK